ncbi:CBS domain-containing protein [Natronobacterium gregoryi]|uniref:CBS domain-containing protein n=2 Tax=Natronobacterium gregoryi TaxID=44930 RepID=L9Y1G1_NATGS|nr:CBS domain-containing protein [Natronobacterium gregoryi]ELY67885.1 hypothetical protein C490_10335 [Natronobacterium gregoryi SP2]PLK20008.1 CBS domain-containing protein [Natronobacterium gregoryi SP2]SFJ34422.1 magnesium transporter [Natronobacterium gregoryi]
MPNTLTGLVSDEFQTAPPTTTVDEAIDRFRDRTPTDGTTLYYLYVVDGGDLIGIVSLTDLLNADRTAAVEKIMTTDIQTVSTDTPIAAAVDTISERGFPALPVTEDSDIAGVVRADDLLETVENELTITALKKAGFWV